MKTLFLSHYVKILKLFLEKERHDASAGSQAIRISLGNQVCEMGYKVGNKHGINKRY